VQAFNADARTFPVHCAPEKLAEMAAAPAKEYQCQSERSYHVLHVRTEIHHPENPNTYAFDQDTACESVFAKDIDEHTKRPFSTQQNMIRRELTLANRTQY
jgi:hypothetical protein